MKKRIDSEFIKLLFLTALLVGICLSICVSHVFGLKDTYRKNILDKINAQTRMGSQILCKEFEKSVEIVTAQATKLEHKGGLSQKVIKDALEECQNQNRFQNVYYVNSIGTVYRADGTYFQIGVDHMEALGTLTQTPQIYLETSYANDIDKRFAAVAPVSPSGNLRGYFVGVDRADSVIQNVSMDDLEGVVHAYITYYDGTVIAANNYEQLGKDTNNFFDHLVEKSRDPGHTEAVINDLYTQLLQNQGGICMVPLQNQSIYITYEPIECADRWNLICCIDERDIQLMLRPVIRKASLTCILIILILLLLVAVVWWQVGGDQKKIKNLAYCDNLTGASNINYFLMRAKELLHENAMHDYEIICFDIMNFRYINESYGHEKADQILIALVKALKESFSYNETFARVNADKFVCLAIADGRDRSRKKFVEERVNRFNSQIMVNYPIHIKSGIYRVTNYRESIPEMIDKADLARKSVSGEKVRVAYYEESLMASIRKREYIESKMKEALGNGEFKPYFQAKWDMKNNCIYGAEALVRWIRQDGSIIYPNEFIPIFEKNGFIEKLDYYMLECVFSHIRRMLKEGKHVYPVSVNQSRYLLHNKQYVDNIRKMIEKYDIPTETFELELTETVFFLEKDLMIETMKRLHEMNVRLSIDDFGSGFSSLNILKDIQFDALKIDREFLDETATSKTSEMILKKIIEMADALHVEVICEGVENEKQAQMLMKIGCQIVQGYYYAKPISLSEYENRYYQ
ncbi:MAG: EAL domain-containing protein [Clostridia bacterium]|nr:EAL domain-containing protein [Clostridia bacterium]